MLIRLSNVQVLGDFSQSSCSVNFCQKETVASRPMNWPMYQMSFPENCNQNMKFNEKAQLNRFFRAELSHSIICVLTLPIICENE